jgi:hypothetical protein
MTARDLADKIHQDLLGTCESLSKYQDEYSEIETDDLEEALMEFNVERCAGCGWWYESGDLVDEDLNEETTGYCADCREAEYE